MRMLTKSILLLVLCATSVMTVTRAVADEWPLAGGDFWEVTGVHIKDGGALAYANFLAAEWRDNQEMAKTKGWIKGYKILGNAYARTGEPDLYLITITDHIPSGAEGEKRQAEYMEWKKKTISQMEKESGNRAEFREIGSNELLQELVFRK